MKAIMKNIKPQTCSNIMNLIQSILVIKDKREAKDIQKLIDEYGFAEIYGYCGKNGGNLVYGTEYRGGNFIDEYGITRGYSKQKANEIFGLLNDKVLFKFHCYKIEEILNYGLARRSEVMMRELLKDSCLTMKELNEYAPHKEYDDDDCIYAIHISDLSIFDEPKELSEFLIKDKEGSFKKPYKINAVKYLTKAPRNFCYVEVE